MSLTAAEILAILQAIRWVIGELAGLRADRGEQLSEEEARLLEARLRERILSATETDRGRWARVLRHYEELDHA